mgnify:CR=1 FL=1
MNSRYFLSLKPIVLIVFLFLLTACAAGNVQFTSDTPAGFWYGLWHGVISFITLIIHVFNDSVSVYETNNTGGWYDFGFLLGVIFIWGGGCHAKCKSSSRKKRDQEWEEIGDKVEIKVMRKLKNWAEDENGDETGAENKQDWDDTCKKVERKLKRKLREWAEKE